MSFPILPGRYRLIGSLGQGGMATVWRVLDHTSGRELALKLVGRADSEWLRQEFNTLRQIKHENLIQVFDHGDLESGETYYTMEFVDGSDLGRHLVGPLHPELVLQVLGGILRGLGHLHCHGEVHGDLKPGNVLIAEGQLVKLGDVGMGRGDKSTSSGSGTPGYTAPEVWSGQPASERSDLYSVGVIAYEALTGVHPFKARTVREVISGQVEGWVPAPSTHGARLRPELERAIMRALERDPGLRQGSADELVEGLGLERDVGEILGGRFVDRGAELTRLGEFIARSSVNSPTLMYIEGPNGVGKSALIEESLKRAPTDWKIAESELLHANGDEPASRADAPSEPGHVERLSKVAGALIARYSNRGILLIQEESSNSDIVRSIARYVWAEASERGVASNVRFVIAGLPAPDSLEPFEDRLRVTPFERPTAEDLILGLLGRIQLHPAFIEKLLGETGGVPGALVGAVLELVDRQLIWRRFGEWQVGEIEESDWESLRWATSRHERDWSHLSETDKDVLTAIGVISSGLQKTDLALVFPGQDLTAAIERIKTRGFVTVVGGNVSISSRDIARTVEREWNADRLRRIRSRVFETVASNLPRMDRAGLLLELPPSEEAVAEGLWLGNDLQDRQNYEQSTRVFLRTRDLARLLGNQGAARLAALAAARTMRRAGAYGAAASLLQADEEWSCDLEGGELKCSRLLMLGSLSRDIGDNDAAERYFSQCIQAARRAAPKLWLQAEAELAEMEWRHRGQPGRDAATARISALTPHQRSFPELHDEWAALKYQLGASLVVEGRRDAAIPILKEALNQAESTYWLMRINNALAAAYFYLGEMKAGIDAANTAWRFATDGHFDSFKPRILASRGALRAGLGQFREAAEQDLMAAFWGRRMGNRFEFEASLISAVYDFYLLADYERAIRYAQEGREVAMKINNGRDVSKSLELEGLINIHLGDYDAAANLLTQARVTLEGRGFDDIVPRLLWHEGRLDMERGKFVEAEGKFRDALQILEQTLDYEDLPGVKVELQLLFARARDQRLDFEELRRLLEDSSKRDLGSVRLRAAVALGEVAVTVSRDQSHVLDLLMESLRYAEGAGADEYVWRLSFWISRILRSGGDLRGATTRLGNAVRIVREVASRLTPEHRSTYLQTSHARLLLAEAR